MEFVYFCAMAGAFAGLALSGLWASAAFLFGFARPNPDQVGGLVGLCAIGVPIVAGALVAVMTCLEDRAASRTRVKQIR